MGAITPSGGDRGRGEGLSFRIATHDDFALLREMRIECGWGIEKLEKRLGKPDWIFCIFCKVLDGVSRDVGMGGWCLAWPYDGALPDEEDLASREDKRVFLTSLFIRKQYQRLGLGGAAMDILETTAKDVYGAEYVTLDTIRWHSDYIPPLGLAVEDQTRDSKTVAWYKSRGYEEFREPIPLFPHPSPDDPNFKLTATFFKKKV